MSGEGTLRVSRVPSGTATGTTTWHGFAVGVAPDDSDSDKDVLDAIFQMLALIAEQGQNRGLSPGEAFTLMALLIALLDWLGITPR